MRCDKGSIQHQVLDLLVDAPNSLASLYQDLVNLYGYPREISCDYLLDVIYDMEVAGLLRTMIENEDKEATLSTISIIDRNRIASEYNEWLSKAPLPDLSFDKVGVWMEITECGRELWKEWAKLFGDDATSSSEWQAGFNFDNNEIVIVSRNESEARRILENLCAIKKSHHYFRRFP
ncbi:MAG: hypothetical protein P0120_20570 [Nitrospira sp.]|nr:hypothetical protein [Nitrospira sp.]